MLLFHAGLAARRLARSVSAGGDWALTGSLSSCLRQSGGLTGHYIVHDQAACKRARPYTYAPRQRFAPAAHPKFYFCGA
jgi:hypothetical protein